MLSFHIQPVNVYQLWARCDQDGFNWNVSGVYLFIYLFSSMYGSDFKISSSPRLSRRLYSQTRYSFNSCFSCRSNRGLWHIITGRSSLQEPVSFSFMCPLIYLMNQSIPKPPNSNSNSTVCWQFRCTCTFYLSVNVFSTKVLIGDTIFTSPNGDGTAILRGHPSHAKVSSPAVQRKYLHFSVILRPRVIVRPRESNRRPPALQSNALPTELILPRFNCSTG